MQTALHREIERQAKKAIRKTRRDAELQSKYRKRFHKRTGLVPSPPTRSIRPPVHRHFDPVYVKRHAKFLARAIWNKVLAGQYQPLPAVVHKIEKPSGGVREIRAFSIPDAALANLLMRSARDRNLKRLPPHSYAYRPDKNLFDAILTLRAFDSTNKMFAVQIDFEKFFDSIPHGYIKEKVDDPNGLSLTPHERFVFKEFLAHRFSEPDGWTENSNQRSHRGTPQGSSVSLLLANMANHDLDQRLGLQPGIFVRFADDVTALCSSYAHAQELEQTFRDHCTNSNLTLNKIKSPGISIVSNRWKEIRTEQSFTYLGYKFSEDGLSIPDTSIQKLKIKISRLINIYLIRSLRLGFNGSRASVSNPQYDWDLLGLITEIRNILYGGLSESDLQEFVVHGRKLNQMRGYMGFFCLLDDAAPLKELDGWLLSTIRRAQAKRNLELGARYGAACPTPSNRQLATGSWLDARAWRGGMPPNARVPSLVRGWRAARKHYFTFGLEEVQAPNYGQYLDFDFDLYE